MESKEEFLRYSQHEAVNKMHNGCILCGGVGSGKSRTSLAYYYIQQGGVIEDRIKTKMKIKKPLYIITTARKRDTLEWDIELAPFGLSKHRNSFAPVVVDSWNNIHKYKDVKDSFFIFDEQRVVGKGEWVKSFISISKRNDWILLSATPGDTWTDYIPVFIANGFYKSRKEFNNEHIVYSRYTKFPKIEKYLNTGRLVRLRNSLLVNIDLERHTVSHHQDIWVSYDQILYKSVVKDRWNIFEDKPIENASEYCSVLRHIVNSDSSRQEAVLDLMQKNPKAIIFYNYDYELDILKNLCETVKNYDDNDEFEYAEWNGHKHQPIPESKLWIYLVQYNAGCEGWNCIKTDTIIFYSQNYSYRIMEQARGRIDRMNTPFKDLYYYHLKSHASIDLMISRALNNKKKFNEGGFYKNGRA